MERKSFIFRIEKEVWTRTLEGLSHSCFTYMWVIKIIPFVINWVFTFCCIVTKINVPWMIHHPHQIVNRIFNRFMARLCNKRTQIKSWLYFYIIIEFNFPPFAVGEPLKLENQYFRKTIKVNFSFALPKWFTFTTVIITSDCLFFEKILYHPIDFSTISRTKV